MLKRKMYDVLVKWKNDKDKVPLVVRGARQIGKTFTIDNFARENYKNYLYINFELQPDAKQIFDGNLDIDTLIRKLSISYLNVNLQSNETIIFLDEIQSCPAARTALKTFSLDKRFDVIASGSLLGLNYREVSSYPVGYEEIIDMHSLDFEEFLWALGMQDDMILFIKECFEKRQEVPVSIHEKMKEYFIWHLLVGGMPAVVNTFLTTNDFAKVLNLQKRIINSYLNDISKYAAYADKIKARSCFLSIPNQLAKTNKKFQYSEIEDVGSSRKYANSLQWLYDAGIINYCHNLQEPRLPFKMHKESNKFKIYMRDTGLLMAMLEHGAQREILNGNLLINNGGIYENIIADIFTKKYGDIFYFEKKGKLEIDFMLNIDGKATAIEVKSGDNTKAKSLHVLMSDKYKVEVGYKLTKHNLYIEDKVLCIPWYMVMFL